MNRQTLALPICVWALLSPVTAADQLTLADASAPSQWRLVDQTRQTARSENRWAWRTYAHESTADLLTVACLDVELSVGSADLVDRSYEFAASGHPWVAEQDDSFDSSPGCTTELTWQLDVGENLPARTLKVLQFVHTSLHRDDENKTRMLHGFIFVHDQKTYFVQHTSPRPIPVWTARQYARKLANSL